MVVILLVVLLADFSITFYSFTFVLTTSGSFPIRIFDQLNEMFEKNAYDVPHPVKAARDIARAQLEPHPWL